MTIFHIFYTRQKLPRPSLSLSLLIFQSAGSLLAFSHAESGLYFLILVLN